MHWGRDPALEKHYVPTRSQRARSVLTFFAQDTGTHNLVYANADLSKATQQREVIAFCDHWKQVSGSDPKMLIMDQKVTTQEVLGELNERGVKFLTLRMRSPALVNTSAAWPQGLHYDHPGPARPAQQAESARGPRGETDQLPRHRPPARRHRPGREQPTVIITNDTATKTRALISQYARRMTIEQRLAEIIRAFCADALSSTVNLTWTSTSCSPSWPRP